jgi:hypothetical protein
LFIIVIHSGNHEFIGVHNRGNQTLYISDWGELYACKEPSYGKLYVGIYVAPIRDAINRERQVHNAQPPDGGDGPPDEGRDNEGNPNGSDPDNWDWGLDNSGDDGGSPNGSDPDDGDLGSMGMTTMVEWNEKRAVVGPKQGVA